MRPNNPLAQKDLAVIGDLAGRRYPMPMGEQFAELRDAAMGILDAYGIKPVFRSILASTFEEYLFEIEDDEILLMVEYPLDADRDGFVCNPFDPAMGHRNYLMVKSDAENPALRLFFDYVRENWDMADNQDL